MTILAVQSVPAEPRKDLWRCWSPTAGQWLLCHYTGLNLSPWRKALEQPPSVADWVTALYNASVSSSGRGDVSSTKPGSSNGTCVPVVLGTTDLHLSASPEAQLRADTVTAGQQSDEDEDKDKWAGLEWTCPSELASVYEYIAVVVESDGEFYADCPDVPVNGGGGSTMEEVEWNLKENLLIYFGEVVRGNVPLPPARFKTLDDYEEIERETMFAEEGVNFVCLLPCKITLEETMAWMAREHDSCDPYFLDP
ncbi:hypothetical protein COCOBI_08-1210 [Coccomyxa sp. Obi]|nr:hypothetical protein COCOBI_08-1210 [Coccomyxa sp. Obi]